MLRRCLVFSAGAVAVLCVAAAVVEGWPGVGSGLFGAGIVVAFSGITLLIGHLSGPEDPLRAMGLFVVAYAFKVVAFGAVLLLVGRPEWLAAGWFLASALLTVLVWQVAELRTFALSRLTLFPESDHDAPAEQGRP
jgi:ATP synthase protein I